MLVLAGPATRSYSTFMRLATSCSGTHRAHDEHVQQGCNGSSGRGT